MATAQDDADMRAARMLYQTAMKCFVADAHASNERRRAGDSAKAAAYQGKSREAFDLVYRAGEKIGLSDDAIHRDLDFSQETELPRFIQDQSYLMQTASTCKALGLM